VSDSRLIVQLCIFCENGRHELVIQCSRLKLVDKAQCEWLTGLYQISILVSYFIADQISLLSVSPKYPLPRQVNVISATSSIVLHRFNI
jgi:hypothetical protein